MTRLILNVCAFQHWPGQTAALLSTILHHCRLFWHLSQDDWLPHLRRNILGGAVKRSEELDRSALLQASRAVLGPSRRSLLNL